VPLPAPLVPLPLDGWRDAETLFAALFGESAAAGSSAFWLDAGPDSAEGWSILGAGDPETDPDAVGTTALTGTAVSSPVPFDGGWVGWLDYEHGAAAAGAPIAASDASPTWIAVSTAIALDHAHRRVWALAAAPDAERWRARVQHAMTDAAAAPAPIAPEASTAEARHGVRAYVGLVEECREAIRRGDAYQLCLTTRFSAPRPRDPLAVYRRLRAATPAHHGGYLRIGERHLLSASPEQFLAVADGVASTSPIKGTRPRHADAEEDARLAEELRTDVKERAENVMIVDLMRNDLSHVGDPATLRVDRLWQVESYPAVHQLVSQVSVRLRDGIRFADLCEATFPAGSMTGAPKLSAMTNLHRLEGAARGVYSGCFGHVGLDGRVDLAMVIRSIVVQGEEAYVGAGGGITWLSRPDAEAAEVATKARAPLAALGTELPEEWAALLLPADSR